MTADLSITIGRHGVPSDEDKLSPLQRRILSDPAPVRVFSAPTGAGKSYVLFRAAQERRRVLFVVPTRRLAQNLATEASKVLEPSFNGLNPVALWSSDETARQKELDPGYRPWQARVREVRQFEDAQFIVATPESVALMLLRAPSSGHGSDPFGVSHLTHFFDHIVFDEFHSIDARGFGLCAMAARACTAAQVTTRLTFLSATPVDLLPTLTALGVPRDCIAVAEETVLDCPNGDTPPGTRILHGDVRVAFVTEPDMAALLEQHEKQIKACLGRGRQVVVVFDSLEELHIQKDRIAAAFDRLGVPAARRLAINSIDDSARSASLDGLFVTDRQANPVDYPVLLATSSIEMGVTFAAGMLIIDPGHDALSFVQRVGRVARRDEPGLVVVRLDPGRLGRKDWLRLVMEKLRTAPEAPRFPVSCFLDIVLEAARNRFAVRGELQSDDPPRTFRSMPHRAVWAACLFWYALERGQRRHLTGQRRALEDIRPNKVKVIAKLLGVLDGCGPDQGGFGRRWARAFLQQAEKLREIAPTVAVVTPGSADTFKVPMQLIENHPELMLLPLVADSKGEWTLYLNKPLNTALRDATRVYHEPRRSVLLPDGQTRNVSARDVVNDAVREMQKLEKAPGTTARMEAQVAAAINLVRLSGLIPDEQALVLADGSAVL